MSAERPRAVAAGIGEWGERIALPGLATVRQEDPVNSPCSARYSCKNKPIWTLSMCQRLRCVRSRSKLISVDWSRHSDQPLSCQHSRSDL